jgi:hypothetical protein
MLLSFSPKVDQAVVQELPILQPLDVTERQRNGIRVVTRILQK